MQEHVRSAATAVAEGRYDEALSCLDVARIKCASQKPSSAFWKTRALAELGLYKETFAKHRLEAARDAVAKGLQDAKKPKVVVGLGLVECEVLALSGAYEACVAKYKSFFLEYPTFVEDSSLRIKAAQAYRRCDLVDECTDLLQEVMDDPPAPYEEADILLILGVCYEYAGTRDGKRMGKEAFKHAFKKAREAGKVKFASTEESSGADPRSPGVSPGDATGQPQLDLLHSPLKQQPKHITFAEWKADPETWTSLATRCRACGDLVFALDFYTKGLWTESGQQDPALWMQFAELSYVMGEVDAAVQACATLYYMQPFDLSLRARLGMWDPQGWGAHIALEEATITKVQALLRGRWGRRYAAEHKRRVVAERARRRAAAIEIQRTVARGVQGRAKAQRRRDQIAAEWAAYQRFLLETAATETLQRFWRCARARMDLNARRKHFAAARTIQCFVRSALARIELADLRRTYTERMRERGATKMQKICRGFAGRRRARIARRRRDAARHIQRIWRGFRARKDFHVDLANFRGARAMQRIARGYLKRKWYKGLRGASTTRIQTAFRAYLCRTAFPGFRRGMTRFRRTLQTSNTPFTSMLDALHSHIPSDHDHHPHQRQQQQQQQQQPKQKQQEQPHPTEQVAAKETENPHETQRPNSALAKTSDIEKIAPQDARPDSAPTCITIEKNPQVQGEIQQAPKQRRASQTHKTSARSRVAFVNVAPDPNVTVKTLKEWLVENHRQAECIWTQHLALGPRGATEIANILQTNETVTEIGLGAGSELGVHGTTAIAEMMRCHNFRFRRLMIDEQPELQDEGTLPIVKAVGDFFFGRYSRLEELSLRNTGLGDVAVIALVEGLELNTKLRRLHLEQNRIRDAGAAALGAIFPRNETLEELDLRDNRIASEGAATLVRALESTCAGVKAVRGLHLLRLDANFITTCGGSAIIRCLRASRKHRRVLRITASANPFGSRLHEEIREYMGSNKASSHLLPEVRNPLTSASAACAFMSEGPDDEANPASDVAGEDGANPRLQIQGPPFSRPSKALLQLGPVKKPRSRTSPYLSQPWALRSVKAHPQASLRPRGAFAA